jgi:hypothetical protein
MAANDKEDDLYDRVAEMADRLKLKGEERGRYVHEHMTRGGYKAVPNYVKADDDGDDDDDKGSGFFGSSRRSRSSRDDDGGRGRRKRDDDDDWYR